VFAWYRHANFSSLGMTTLEPGVVRAFTIGTPARPHFARVVHHWGDFRALVAPITARLARRGTTNCTAT